jgi:hypothetical protein
MLTVTFGANKFVAALQASDGEKSDQDLVVDDASEVIIKNFTKSSLIL